MIMIAIKKNLLTSTLTKKVTTTPTTKTKRSNANDNQVKIILISFKDVKRRTNEKIFK